MNSISLLRTDKEITEIYERNADMVYRLCRLYLKNPADAEDAVQTVFIRLMESAKPFAGHEHEKAWLITTTRNYCYDSLKHWWKKRRVDMDDLPEVAHWDKHELNEVLVHLLSLPEKYKTVLYLYYYEGYKAVDIAAILKRKESTVRTQLRKGRAILKIDLGGAFLE